MSGIALFEVDKLVKNGMTKAQFESTRDYLMKNVFVITANANQQIGYALDSQWYGIGEYTKVMRDKLAAQGAESVGNTPEEFRAYVRTEIDKWARVIRASGMPIE